jgi:hypothetical protein
MPQQHGRDPCHDLFTFRRIKLDADASTFKNLDVRDLNKSKNSSTDPAFHNDHFNALKTFSSGGFVFTVHTSYNAI